LKIFLYMDGRRIEADEGKTLLQAALDANLYIPHLCFHEDLGPLGACGLCGVEIEGWDGVIASCATLVQEGMVVTTRSANIRGRQSLSNEFLLAGDPAECATCPKSGVCGFQPDVPFPSGWHHGACQHR